MFRLLLPAALALFSLAAGAAPPRADDPAASVPETPYRSAAASLPDYRPAERPATTPDRHWIEANRSVAGYNPMMLTMPERAPARALEKPEAVPAHEHATHAAHGEQTGKGQH